MTIWLALPSKKPVAEAEACLALWRARGYRIGVWRDLGDPPLTGPEIQLTGRYPGYYAAVNAIIREILAAAKDPAWIVCAGDDMEPDPNHTAEEIAAECTTHFGGTFGVMQPTGDRWGHDTWVYADHVCGSPWLGKEFCRRIYSGKGPYPECYYHMFGDEELFEVAVLLGLFWQRKDLMHYHRHFAREHKPPPAYWEKANRDYGPSERIFKTRKAAGFPGHEPLP